MGDDELKNCLLKIAVTFGYYAKSKDDPTKIVYIQPKRIRSFEELTNFHKLGAALFNKEGAFYVNEILDIQSELSDDDSDDNSDVKQLSMTMKTEAAQSLPRSKCSNCDSLHSR